MSSDDEKIKNLEKKIEKLYTMFEEEKLEKEVNKYKLKKIKKKIKEYEKYKCEEECSESDYCFDRKKSFNIRLIYSGAIVLWIFILSYLGIFNDCLKSWFGFFFIFLPITIFILASFNLEYVKYFHRKYLMKGNVPYVAFVAIGLFINWKIFSFKTPLLFFRLIFLSIIFLALSVLDFWFPDVMVTMCIRTIFQTLAISLLLISLYVYCVQIVDHYDDIIRDE